jgi:hypothetical protein
MRTTLLVLSVALHAGALAAGCKATEEVQPILVEATRIIVDNRTADPWSNVEVWVNDHYRVTKPTMAAGERFMIPLDAFVAGFGQRFDPKRQVVQGVEVTARARAGAPVRLIYGRGRRQ